VSHSERHGRQSLTGDQTSTIVSSFHGSPVSLSGYRPEIDHLLATVIAQQAQLPALNEVLGERLADRLKVAAHVAFDGRAV
jgi:hypothetical protein